MVLQTICPQPSAPQRGRREAAAVPQEGPAEHQHVLLIVGNLQQHFHSLLPLLSRAVVWDGSKGSSQFKSRVKMPDFFPQKSSGTEEAAAKL